MNRIERQARQTPLLANQTMFTDPMSAAAAGAACERCTCRQHCAADTRHGSTTKRANMFTGARCCISYSGASAAPADESTQPVATRAFAYSRWPCSACSAFLLGLSQRAVYSTCRKPIQTVRGPTGLPAPLLARHRIQARAVSVTLSPSFELAASPLGGACPSPAYQVRSMTCAHARAVKKSTLGAASAVCVRYQCGAPHAPQAMVASWATVRGQHRSTPPPSAHAGTLLVGPSHHEVRSPLGDHSESFPTATPALSCGAPAATATRVAAALRLRLCESASWDIYSAREADTRHRMELRRHASCDA